MAFSISDKPIQQDACAPVSPGAGAVVLFEGRVRSSNEGRTVLGLEYTAYEALAVKEGDRLIAEALQRFSILSVDIIHRVGALAIGDLAVLVRVQSAHRAAAFEASVWIMDELKQRVPIWKHERYEDSAKWL